MNALWPQEMDGIHEILKLGWLIPEAMTQSLETYHWPNWGVQAEFKKETSLRLYLKPAQILN